MELESMDCDYKIEIISEDDDEDFNEDGPILTIGLETSEPNSEMNPWASKNLKEFLFYNCPECEYQASFEPDFYEHAVSTHQKAKDVFEVSNEVESIEEVIDYVPSTKNKTYWYVYPDQPPNSVHTLTNQSMTESTVFEMKNIEFVAEEYSDLKTESLFNSIEMLEEYMEDNKLLEFKCPDCLKIFDTKEQFDKHQSEKFGNDNLHKWYIPLPKSVQESNQLKIFKKNGKFVCPFKCGTSFEKKTCFSLHFVRKDKKVITCKTLHCAWERANEFGVGPHSNFIVDYNSPPKGSENGSSQF